MNRFSFVLVFLFSFCFLSNVLSQEVSNVSYPQNALNNDTLSQEGSSSSLYQTVIQDGVEIAQEVFEPEIKIIHRVIITAFTASKAECGKTDGITKSGLKVRKGIIACNFLPIGTKVRIPSLFGRRIFVVADRMAKSKINNIDVYAGKVKLARIIGKSFRTIEVLG